MKPNVYKLLDRCVEEGIEYGYNRAHKYVDTPSSDVIKNEIYRAVMNEIYEWFEMSEEKKEEDYTWSMNKEQIF